MIKVPVFVTLFANVAAISPECGNLSGFWSAGWPADYHGSPGGSPDPQPPATIAVAVRKHKPGSFGAQYMAGGGADKAFGQYGQLLHIYANNTICLGNGTCHGPAEEGTVRALNRTSPPCSFIQWAPSHYGHGWCKVPSCPLPPAPAPPPPQYNLSWPPTYNMSLSTLTMPNGNTTGLDNAERLRIDAKYGMITFDGSFEECIHQRTDAPPDDVCKYAKRISDMEAQARNIKAINPHTRVGTYHNMELGLQRNYQDCEKMYDPAFSGFFLRSKSGAILNDGVLQPNRSRECASVAPWTSYRYLDQYFIDWRNQSAADWWLEEVIGGFIKSPVLDTFYWDDPGFGGDPPCTASCILLLTMP